MKVRHIRRRVYRKAGGPPGYGRRCKTFCPGCIVCEGYRFLDEFGRFPTFDEASPRCDAAMREQSERELLDHRAGNSRGYDAEPRPMTARTQTDEIGCAGAAEGEA